MLRRLAQMAVRRLVQRLLDNPTLRQRVMEQAQLRQELHKARQVITLLEGEAATARAAARKEVAEMLEQLAGVLAVAVPGKDSLDPWAELLALVRKRSQRRDVAVSAMVDSLARIGDALRLYLAEGPPVLDAQWRKRCEVLMSWAEMPKGGR